MTCFRPHCLFVGGAADVQVKVPSEDAEVTRVLMMQPQTIASLPVWVAGSLISGVAIGVAALIELLIRSLVPARLREAHTTVAASMFNVVGTTYSVLLAFVAMLAWDGYNRAGAVTDDEASLVLVVYQLADGLGGPEMAAMQADIVAYGQHVVGAEWPAQAKGTAVAETDPSLTRLTRTALHLHPGTIADSNLQTLLLEDLTRLGSARRERLLIQRTPVPPVVWFVLLAGGGISVAFSSFLGSQSLAMHLAMSSLLALSGALVLLLIVALSNPFRGDFSITSQPFEHALAQMAPSHVALPETP